MRRYLACLAALPLLFAPAAAYADVFTFTPDDGSGTITIDTTNATESTYLGLFVWFDIQDQDALTDVSLRLFNSTFSQNEGDKDRGFGDYNVLINDYNYATNTFRTYLLDGPQMYAGDENNPQFLTGVYSLDADPNAPPVGGTFTVNAAATPEPSSLALLGTGILGTIGAVRRRLLAA